MVNIQYAYQLELQWIAKDEMTGASLFQSGVVFETAEEFWQESVDFIYRCLKSGLIVVQENCFSNDPLQIVQVLAQEHINILQSDKIIGNHAYWHWVHFYGSETLKYALNKYELDFWESPPNSDFILWLESLFNDYGVPFNENPIIPIAIST